VLVVDDDLVQRRVIAKMAAQAGYEVAEACSVAEAETCLAERPVDCVTVDIGLTDGNGADLLHLVAEKCPRAQALIITGASSGLLNDTLKVARENGTEIHDVFIKPLDLVGLRDSLRRAREASSVRGDAA
jgi:DNA-binding NtrC family response regulator